MQARSLLGCVGCVVAVTCAVGARASSAEPDYRPSDRFFFGIAGGVGGLDAADGSSYAPAGAYETTFYPTDYLGLSTIVAIHDAHTCDAGGQLVLAVPLRWIQPYGGAMAGWRTTADDVALRVHLVGGANVYASRNLRLFVELRDPDVTLVGDSHEPAVLAGLRWSPDWFHRARRVTKVDTLWWSTLLAAGIWTGATLAR
ncbi:MAG TPA: hypothetical protein VHE35_05400 [Kofleriaceae bacterium]|nr:hypothetical protein [Kofleriaceae bacterium]